MVVFEREEGFYELLGFAKNRYPDCQIASSYRPEEDSVLYLGKYGFRVPTVIPKDIFRQYGYWDFLKLCVKYLDRAHKDLCDITKKGNVEWETAN